MVNNKYCHPIKKKRTICVSVITLPYNPLKGIFPILPLRGDTEGVFFIANQKA